MACRRLQVRFLSAPLSPIPYPLSTIGYGLGYLGVNGTDQAAVPSRVVQFLFSWGFRPAEHCVWSPPPIRLLRRRAAHDRGRHETRVELLRMLVRIT